MLRLKHIEENHQKSLKSIQEFLNSDYPEMRAITELLCETDVNPYSFLPDSFANLFFTASGFNSILGIIHHALFDDGDISFPIVNGEPRILFVSQWEDNYEDYALNETEKMFKRERGNTYTIEQCKDVFDFILKFEKYNSNKVRQWFITDAAIHGIDFSVKHNSKYARFDPDWEFDDIILKEIEELRAVRQNYLG